MALARERRLPHHSLSLDLPLRAAADESALRCANLQYAAPPSASASTSAARSAAEFRLSDFDKLAVLGRGNSGTVYKARHRRTSARYALKVLHYGDSTAATEAEILRRTDSPFIVRCHSILPTSTSDAILLELMDGGSLDSHTAFPEAALSEVAAQALAGLAYLHSRRNAHLDIKPANLLVSTDGEVKITDVSELDR